MEILLIAMLIGVLPAAIARSKGRSFVLWWLYGSALFIAALPHSILTRTLDGNQAGESKRCPFCAESIKAAAIKCRFCGSEVPPVAKQIPNAGSVQLLPEPGDRALLWILGSILAFLIVIVAAAVIGQAGRW